MQPTLLYDSWIIAVKEWREWGGVRARIAWVVLIVLLAGWSISAPHLLGGLDGGPLVVAILSAAFPLALAGIMITDVLAGERERHTLETLLASRLPDRAIMLGKVIAVTVAGWVLLLLAMLPGFFQHVFVKVAGYEQYDLRYLGAAAVTFGALCIMLIVLLGALNSLYIASARFALLLTVMCVGSLVLGVSGLTAWWIMHQDSTAVLPLIGGSILGLVILNGCLLAWLLLSGHRDRMLAIG
jgi:ABC-2 type transport system permease protein